MKNIIQSLFWGMIAAGTALFLELIFASFLKIDNLETIDNTFLIIIALSVFIEEIIKYLIVFKELGNLSFGRSVIVNAWIAGVGFSLVEIFIFYQKISAENLFFDQIDLIKVILLHILTFGVFGYRIAVRKNDKFNIIALLAVISLHFIYNVSTQYTEHLNYPVENLVLIILILYNIFGFIAVNKKLAHE